MYEYLIFLLKYGNENDLMIEGISSSRFQEFKPINKKRKKNLSIN